MNREFRITQLISSFHAIQRSRTHRSVLPVRINSHGPSGGVHVARYGAMSKFFEFLLMNAPQLMLCVHRPDESVPLQHIGNRIVIFFSSNLFEKSERNLVPLSPTTYHISVYPLIQRQGHRPGVPDKSCLASIN